MGVYFLNTVYLCVHVVGGDFYAYKQHDHISEYLYFGKLAVTFHLCIIIADVCVKIVLMLLQSYDYGS